MSIFLIWISFALLCIGLYILLLWMKNRHRSRFRLKLTIFFLLFVLVPTIPLTFFTANLLTQSADLLIIPGIGSALNISLETIRIQVEEKGKTFFREHADPGSWSREKIENRNLFLVGLYELNKNDFKQIHRVTSGKSLLPVGWLPKRETIVDAIFNNRSSSLISAGDQRVITVYHIYSESRVAVAVYPVSDQTLKAKDEITQVLGIYNTLSLLKESIIERNLIWGLAVLLIVGLAILSISVAGRLSRGITEPIQDMVQGMQRIADGDLTSRVTTKAKDEFRFLVDSFNQMIQDLEESRQKLIEAERMTAWQDVARRISHEIKNSLTPLAISLRGLRNHLLSTETPKNISDSLQSVEDEFESLKRMAAEFSDFARMPAPEKEALNLNEVVRSVVYLLTHAMGEVKMETKLDPDLPFISADRKQIKQVLNNLIKNGIEASHDRGIITISTRPSQEESFAVDLTIEDQGDGMDPDILGKIFQPYFTTKGNGTGLGLAITRKIIDDHAGEIVVSSDKGKGTCFTIRF